MKSIVTGAGDIRHFTQPLPSLQPFPCVRSPPIPQRKISWCHYSDEQRFLYRHDAWWHYFDHVEKLPRLVSATRDDRYTWGHIWKYRLSSPPSRHDFDISRIMLVKDKATPVRLSTRASSCFQFIKQPANEYERISFLFSWNAQWPMLFIFGMREIFRLRF